MTATRRPVTAPEPIDRSASYAEQVEQWLARQPAEADPQPALTLARTALAAAQNRANTAERRNDGLALDIADRDRQITALHAVIAHLELATTDTPAPVPPAAAGDPPA